MPNRGVVDSIELERSHQQHVAIGVKRTFGGDAQEILLCRGHGGGLKSLAFRTCHEV